MPKTKKTTASGVGGEPRGSPWLDQIERLYRRTQRLYERGQYGQAMENATRTRDLARQHLGDEHPLVAASLNHLAALYKAMGDDTAALPLLKQALEIERRALGEEHELVGTSLDALAELGVGLFHRYERTEQSADLDAAIEALQAAVDGAPADFQNRPEFLSLLGAGLAERYKRTGQLADLDAAIAAIQQAVDSARAGSPDHRRYLDGLGAVLAVRYALTGRLADLDAAIEPGPPHRP